MRTTRQPSRAAPGCTPRLGGNALRSALAGGLAIGLMVFVTSPGGADPRGEPGQRATFALSDPVIVRASDASTPGHDTGPAAPAAPGTSYLEADLGMARANEALAHSALAESEAEQDKADDVQAVALGIAEAAQDELMRARTRLGELMEAEDAVRASLARAVTRVERTRAGSKAGRSAFTDWQMAAVAERAAHARRSIAEEVGARRFAEVLEAERSLADAELARFEASSAHRSAERAATSASARVTELEALVGTVASPAGTTGTVAPGANHPVQP